MISLKIALLISSLSDGGAERVTCNLANYLSDYDNDVTMITMSDIDDTYPVNSEIKRYYLLTKKNSKNFIYNNFLRYKRLKQFLLNNDEIDCYITMLPIPSFMLMKLKKYTRAKIVYAERNNPKSYAIYKQIMMKYIQGKCDGLVVQTKVIGQWYKSKNMIIIPNAINKEFLTNKDRKNIKNKIVSVGRLEKQKNYPMLIKAFSLFLDNNPDYTLEIYGKGSLYEHLKIIASDLKIADKVIFKGYTKNIIDSISDAKMFVMTSDFEGMPNALIEAMCLGVPCISTDCDGGGAQELIKNNVNGILINKNDVESLVQSMERIASNKEFAKDLSGNSILLREELSFEKIYCRWLQFIKRICE